MSLFFTTNPKKRHFPLHAVTFYDDRDLDLRVSKEDPFRGYRSDNVFSAWTLRHGNRINDWYVFVFDNDDRLHFGFLSNFDKTDTQWYVYNDSIEPFIDTGNRVMVRKCDERDQRYFFQPLFNINENDATTYGEGMAVTDENDGYIFHFPLHRIKGWGWDMHLGGVMHCPGQGKSSWKRVIVTGEYDSDVIKPGIIAPSLKITKKTDGIYNVIVE